MKNEIGLDGSGKQICTKCSHKSLPGLSKGSGLCPYHWAEKNWGSEWAKKYHPDYYDPTEYPPDDDDDYSSYNDCPMS
jgi:hypothetical protein